MALHGPTPPASRGAGRVAVAGAAVVGVAFGMARFAFGLTLPDVRSDLGLPEVLLGLIAGGTFAGFLAGVVLAAPMAARRGSRAPTTVGGVCGGLGALLVAVAPSVGLLSVGAVLAGSAAGWVWAPYSDIVAAVAAPEQRPRLLAVISTGTGAGLVVLGVLGVGAPSWRVVWAGIGLSAALAAVLNLLWVPRSAPPGRRAAGGARRPPLRTGMAPALLYAVAYFGATTLYFTYATDALRAGGQGSSAGPVLFVAIGVSGLAGLATGRVAGRIGPAATAGGCAVCLAGALTLLALSSTSPVAILASSVIFGGSYMVGAAVLAIWTARLAPERATAAFTLALIAGALTSIAVPVLVGALVGALGLPPLLLATALAVLAIGVGLLLPRRRADGGRRRATGAPRAFSTR